MITQYRNTCLDEFFDYNNPAIALWADNVFEKIRQAGELAGYVERNKSARAKHNVECVGMTAPIMVEDDMFTFGCSFCGASLRVVAGGSISAGRAFQLEFEIMFEEAAFGDVSVMDAALTIASPSKVTFGSVEFGAFSFTAGVLYKIKLTRNGLEASLSVNGTSCGNGILDHNGDTAFSTLYEADLNTKATHAANFKITSSGIIKNWWKLNYAMEYVPGLPDLINPAATSGTFRDAGDGDEDFYAYWYSICYVVGAINAYRKVFQDIESYEQVLRRFLQSRDIAYKNGSSLDELRHIFGTFVSDIEKRGTALVCERASDSEEIGATLLADAGSIAANVAASRGLAVLSNAADLVGELGVSINVGKYHTIQFDMLLADADGAQYGVGGIAGGFLLVGSVDTISLTKNGAAAAGIASYTLMYGCNSTGYSFTMDLDVRKLNTVKFTRYSDAVMLYVNGEFVGVKTVTSNRDYSFSNLLSINLPAIANIVVTKKDSEFVTLSVLSWKCNEGSGFMLQSNYAPEYAAVLSIDAATPWAGVWARSPLLDNTGYVGIDGELRREINYTGGECLLELVAESELGMCMDVSSVASDEASCANLNKAYEKGNVTNISKYPLTFSSAVKPYEDNGYITYQVPGNASFWGINPVTLSTPGWKAGNAAMKPNGAVPFVPIPVATYQDGMDGYEVSFVIQSSLAIKLKFGLFAFDKDMNYVANSMKGYDADGIGYMFLDSASFELCKDRDLWVRGIYTTSKLSGVSGKLNVSMGTNLYNFAMGTVRFVAPLINFTSVANVATEVKIKDIVVRPLSLATEKGFVGSKNVVVGFIRNDSGKPDTEVVGFIENKLIPYNCVTNIKMI